MMRSVLRPSWTEERSVWPVRSPVMLLLSSNSFAENYRSRCFPLRSTKLCSRPRPSPTSRTERQPSSCCPVCYLPETAPRCIFCLTSSLKSPRGMNGHLMIHTVFDWSGWDTTRTRQRPGLHTFWRDMMMMSVFPLPSLHCFKMCWKFDDQLQSRYRLCSMSSTSSKQDWDVWRTTGTQGSSPAHLHRESSFIW